MISDRDLLRALFRRHLTGDDFDGDVVDDAANSGTERLVEEVLMPRGRRKLLGGIGHQRIFHRFTRTDCDG